MADDDDGVLAEMVAVEDCGMEEGIVEDSGAFDEETYQRLEEMAGRVRFSYLCQKFENVKAVKPLHKSRTFFDGALKAQIPCGHSLFPVMRLLLPNTDSRLGRYQYKPSSIAKEYKRMLALDDHSDDARKIENFSNPNVNNTSTVAGLGSFANSLREVLEKRLEKPLSDLRVKDINDKLNELASVDATAESRRAVLQYFFDNLSIDEQCWVVRIICGDLKISFSQEAVLKIFENGRLRYSSCADLRKLCAEEALGMGGQAKIQLGKALIPSLALTPNSEDGALKSMADQAFLIERKVDGERMLLHKCGENISLISRKSKSCPQDYLDAMKDTLLQGLQSVHSCILDGELVGWDNEHKDHVPFGTVKEIAKEEAQGFNAHRNLLYLVFDVILLGGPSATDIFHKAGVEFCDAQVVVKLPLSDRRKLLEAMVDSSPNKFEVMPVDVVPAKSPDFDHQMRFASLLGHYEKAVEAGWEGLVIKRLDAPYVLGLNSRTTGYWCKLKPDNLDNLEQMDLIILGGYHRQGVVWRGYPSRFLLGLVARENTLESHFEGDDDDHGSMDVEGQGECGGQEEMKSSSNLSVKGEQGVKQDMGSPTHTQQSSSQLRSQDSKASLTSSQRVKIDVKNGSSKMPYKGKMYYTFAKVASGLNTHQREELEEKLKDLWVDSDKDKKTKRLPGYLKPWNYKKEDYPDVWISDPSKSQLLEIKAAEIVESKSFNVKFTLRFPRIANVRDDKPVEEAMDDVELVELMNRPRMAVNKTGKGDKKRKTKAKKNSHQVVGDRQVVVKGIDVEEKSSVFEGQVFAVLPGDYYLTDKEKAEKVFPPEAIKTLLDGRLRLASAGCLRKLVVEHGAEAASPTVQWHMKAAPGADVDDDELNGNGKRNRKAKPEYESVSINIAPKQSKQLKNLDVITADWVIDCVASGNSRIPKRFCHYLSMTEETEAKLKKCVDEYGDYFMEPVDVSSLRKLMSTMTLEPDEVMHWQDVEELCSLIDDELECFLNTPSPLDDSGPLNLFFFRKRVIYFDRYADLGSSCPYTPPAERHPQPMTRLDAVYYEVRLLGGQVADTLHANVSHVVLDPEDTTRFSEILARLRELRMPPFQSKEKHVVRLEWVAACIEERCVFAVDDSKTFEMLQELVAYERRHKEGVFTHTSLLDCEGVHVVGSDYEEEDGL